MILAHIPNNKYLYLCSTSKSSNDSSNYQKLMDLFILVK